MNPVLYTRYMYNMESRPIAQKPTLAFQQTLSTAADEREKIFEIIRARAQLPQTIKFQTQSCYVKQDAAENIATGKEHLTDDKRQV